MSLAIGASALAGILTPQAVLAWDEPPVIVIGNYPECPAGQVRVWFGDTPGPCAFVGGGGGTGGTGGTGGGPSGGGGGGGGWEPPDYTGEDVAEVSDPQSTCATMEELRLSRANYLAGGFVASASPGDGIVVTLADGNQETWLYLCGGSFCAGTVINVAPIESDCN